MAATDTEQVEISHGCRKLIRRRRFKQLLVGAAFVAILLGGWLNPLWGYFVPACMIAAIMIGLFRGRQWCDWLCPRGSFLEQYLRPGRLRRRHRMPEFLHRLPVRLLMMSVLMTMMTMQLIKRWPHVYPIGQFFVMLLSVTTVIGLVAALAHERGWCAFCPIGTMANWVGRWKYPLRISHACSACETCTKLCPLQLRPWEHKPESGEAVAKVFGDCLKCGLCVAGCPEKALVLAA